MSHAFEKVSALDFKNGRENEDHLPCRTEAVQFYFSIKAAGGFHLPSALVPSAWLGQEGTTDPIYS